MEPEPIRVATNPELTSAKALIAPIQAAAVVKHAEMDAATAAVVVAVAALSARVAALEAGEVADDTATTNLQAAVAALQSSDATKATTLATHTTQIAALQVTAGTLSSAVAALQARDLKGASGSTTIASNLLGGATTDVNITLSPAMPNANYLVFFEVDGGTAVLGNPPTVTLLTGKTATTVPVRVKNNAVLSLSGITVRALALELA